MVVLDSGSGRFSSLTVSRGLSDIPNRMHRKLKLWTLELSVAVDELRELKRGA